MANNKPAEPQTLPEDPQVPDPAAVEPQPPVAPETPPAADLAPAPAPQVTEAQMDRVTRDTAAELAEQPKRQLRLYQVPKGSTESPLPDETVCVNGHIYQIQRGVEVEVPETVYQILEQAGRL